MSRFSRMVHGADEQTEARLSALEQEVAALRTSLAQSQRSNERLSDLLDVVTELLVPAVDRDDERLQAALASAGRATDPLNASRRSP